MKILIVDDDYGARVLLNEILKDFGELDIAVNGLEAVEAFELAWKDNEPYDVIFLDIMMPGKDGHSVLSDIRTYEKNIQISERDGVKIIMTSALDDPKNIMNAYQIGEVSDYLVKPIDKQKILISLQKVMNND